MLTGIDHIIIGVNDLEKATQTFEQTLGLLASGGGRHPFGGTANRIIVIGDTYLELISVEEAAEAQQSMLDRLAKGDGYLNFVLGSDDIEADSQAMRARGVSVNGPNAGALHSAEGRSRGWQRTDVERPDLTQHYPFLIQHDSTGEERRFRLAGWQHPPTHPLGALKVLSTTLVVENLEEATRRFQRIYGLEPSIQFGGEHEGWDALLVSFPLAGEENSGSGHSFELAMPLPTNIDPANQQGRLPEVGSLAAYLQRYGESLCRITLAVADLPAAMRYLDAHGVIYTAQEQPHPLVWIHPTQACGAAIVLTAQAEA
ncbi:VOC family protein [Ktedonobacter racemifer]|uniref:Glyoxalase/bleomycin resistance protein/dioxygenase n=1 Tax=Ktedonobacter racemifer DSM 44963 TaxID=485913 RepID=D6TLT9_KTERA|nr:VOC family protein [Ktedonobacter racemifer]EFH86739.1 Glyoxalase/bleomycin resistance protein/dioxygenase [Ktedonobacter racemifer DSM 44963]